MAHLIALFLIGLMLSSCVSSSPTINIQSLVDLGEDGTTSLDETTVASGGEFIDPAGAPVVPLKAPEPRLLRPKQPHFPSQMMLR